MIGFLELISQFSSHLFAACAITVLNVNEFAFAFQFRRHARTVFQKTKLDGSLPANPVNDRRIANAVTLKSTYCLP